MAGEPITDPEAIPTPEGVPPPAGPPRPRRKPSLLPRVLQGLAIVAVASVAGLGWWWWQRGPAPAVPDIPLAGAEPDLAQAIRSEAERVRQQPRSADAWGRLGKLLLTHAFTEQAAECFANAERFNPRDPRWPYLWAITLLTQNDSSALDAMRRSADLADRYEPDNVAPRLAVAELLLADDRPDEAEQELRRVEQKAPGEARLRYDLGLLACRRGRWQEAVERLRPLANHPSARRKAAAMLAQGYRQLGQFAEADWCNRVARQGKEDVGWPDPYIDESLALGLNRQRRLGDALASEDATDNESALERLRELVRGPGAKDDVAWLMLGTQLQRLGRLQEAEHAMRKAVKLNPGKFRNRYGLALVLFEQAGRLEKRYKAGDERARARYAESAAEARTALAISPGDGWPFWLLGRSLLALGKPHDALEPLRRAAGVRPEVDLMQLALAEALMETGSLDEARTSLERAAALSDEDNPEVARLRARLKELEARPKGAGKGPPRPAR